MKTKEIESMHYGRDHFDLYTENDWWAGDVLESVEPERDGSRLRVKITKITTWNNELVHKDDTFDYVNDKGKVERLKGHRRGVITRGEWPLGGSISCFSLTCRNWRKVA